MPLVLITDANVWIDLHAGKVLAEVVKLDFDLAVPDVIHAEMEDVRSEVFSDLSLLLELEHIRLATSGPDRVQLVEKLASSYRKPQTADLFALAIAIAERAILVTGDKHLRQAAQAEKVEVHGTLWLLDVMVRQGVLTAAAAHGALNMMLQGDRRLPEGDCRRLLRRWSAK